MSLFKRWNLGIGLLLGLGFFSILPCIQPPQAQTVSPSLQKNNSCESFGLQRFPVRKELPTFSLKDLNGKQVSPNDYRGTPLLLFFWGSWCQACKEDIALLEKFYGKLKGQMEILTIAIDGGREKRVRRMVKESKITLPVLLDQKEQVARTYGVRMIPTAYLINGEGQMEGMVVGQRDWCSQEAFSAIKEVLSLR